MIVAGILVGLAALVMAAYSVVGHLGRIADAVEAQNRHYGIATDPEVEYPGEAA